MPIALIMAAVFAVVGIPSMLHHQGNSTMLSNAAAEAVGRTLAIGLLACLGRLYKPNKTLGFGIAALIFTVLAVIADYKVRQSAPFASENAAAAMAEQSAPAPIDEGAIKPEQLAAPELPSTIPLKEEVVPTMGQFTDAVEAGVKAFAVTINTEGMRGAQASSEQCIATARRSANILDTDFCVAFDMSAIMLELGITAKTGMPANSYFAQRAKTLESDFSRFKQASPARPEIIWKIVGDVLPGSLKATLADSQPQEQPGEPSQ